MILRRTISLIPRYDVQLSLWDMLRIRKQMQSLSGRKLRLDNLPPEGEGLYALCSGTAALYMVLAVLDLPPGSGVGVPLYACEAIFESISQQDLRCVFIDVNPDTFEYDPASLRRHRNEMSALILVHAFGYPADFDAVRQNVGDLPIIEDCAHALGSTDNGRPVGTRGVAGVFSFNFHKPISVGGGGALIINDPPLNDRLRPRHAALGKAPNILSWGAILRRTAKATVYRSPWYGLAQAIRRQSRDPERMGPIVLMPMTYFSRASLMYKMNGFDRRLLAQRRWAKELVDAAGPILPACRFVQSPGWNGYIWPVVLPSRESRDRSLAFFRRLGIDAFVLWSNCVTNSMAHGYAIGACRSTQDAVERLMMLPCYAGLTDRQRRRILSALRQWRKEILKD